MFRRCVGNSGYLEWSGNWISFIDTMLQFSIVGLKTKELYLPTRIRKVIIDPAKHLEAVKSDNSCKVYDLSDALRTISSMHTFRLYYYCLNLFTVVPVHAYRDLDVIKSGGIELCGLKTNLAPRRQLSQAAPKLEKYTFVPYIDNKVNIIQELHLLD